MNTQNKEQVRLVMVYDYCYYGHHPEFLRYLMEAAAKEDWSHNRFLFVVHEKGKHLYTEFLDKFEFIFLDDNHVNPTIKENILKRSIREWKLITKICKEKKVCHLMLMHLDAYQYVVGKRTAIKMGIKISGILFHAYTRIPDDQITFKGRLTNSLRKKRKALQIRWMLRNENVHSIYILNDQKSVNFLKNDFKGKFKYLPDPVTPTKIVKKNQELLSKYSVDTKRRIFLSFGSINERKNILNILSSLTLLNARDQSNISFFLFGKCLSEELKENIESLVARLKIDNPNIDIRINNRYSSEEEMAELFSLSDVILIPYLNFYASSGVLGHAAKNNTPSIVSKNGVMSEVVQEYKIGTTVDPSNLKSIAKQIKEYLDKEDITINGSNYVESHSKEAFSKVILSSLEKITR